MGRGIKSYLRCVLGSSLIRGFGGICVHERHKEFELAYSWVHSGFLDSIGFSVEEINKIRYCSKNG